MSHGGNKPFQCIVDGCKHRFGTQVNNGENFVKLTYINSVVFDSTSF